MAKGTISVHTENIFPIIKKWLYSDKDIFLREMVSNACDAITKMKKIDPTLEDAFEIHVTYNKEAKTLTVSDNGIGMTASEIEKYITQVAFSGAEEFLERYKREGEKAEIIGHFGLGFYSSFMVSQSVDIQTKSYMAGAAPAFWTCDGGIEYDLTEGSRQSRGTDIIMHLSDEDADLLDAFKLREILTKYCSFIPVPIYLYEEGKTGEDGEPDKGEMLNEPQPLWLKKPSDCTEEEYKEFYRKVFHEFEEPLFWIHLNVDFPFNLKGILFFPKLSHELEAREGEVKLYNNQVFVADNIKEVIPEYLLLLKGVIDCPDLPLNVSRSFLQNDRQVRKISDHIVKKVADKLTGLFKNERESYNQYWDDINPFIKYGCLKDEKFYEKVKDILILKTSRDRYVTLADYTSENQYKIKQGEQEVDAVYYASSEVNQTQYLNMFRDEDIEVVLLPLFLDNHFINFLEMKAEGAVKFTRIDSVTPDSVKAETPAPEDTQALQDAFKNALENVEVDVQSLKATEIPAMILISEEGRRLKDMQRVFGGQDMSYLFPEERKLILNTNNDLIKQVPAIADEATRKLVCEQVYDLARLSNEPLNAEEMKVFIERSSKVLTLLAK